MPYVASSKPMAVLTVLVIMLLIYVITFTWLIGGWVGKGGRYTKEDGIQMTGRVDQIERRLNKIEELYNVKP